MPSDHNDLPTSADVFTAAQTIAAHIHRTPLITSQQLDALSGARLWFKCEHLQKVGAFKARGACNAVAQLPAPGTGGFGGMVATHSSGNHGAALAWAAAERGLACTVVMPETAPLVKRAAVAGYGADIELCGPSQADRERALEQLVARTGAHVVPPFDDPRIIAGQGTVALEIIQQCRDRGFVPDILVAPVGGGGLLAGIGLAVAALAPEVTVIGAEPAGADDAQRSLRGGVHITTSATPETIADGLRSTLGRRNYAVIRRTVRDIVTVTERGIVEAMQLLWTRTKQLVEPSAAVALAAVLEHDVRFRNKNVAVILTGGNTDLAKLGSE